MQTKRGDRFPAQMALVALGADPNLELVHNTPLSSPNGTPVNELLETDEKGIFAAGDIALFPDRIFGGVQRIQHWENAKEQGNIAGQNMTGKKRVRFEAMPYYWSLMFDLNFEFFGDFSLPAGRMEVEGDRDRKKFVIRCFRGSKLFGRIHCNQDETRREEAKAEIMESQKGVAFSNYCRISRIALRLVGNAIQFREVSPAISNLPRNCGWRKEQGDPGGGGNCPGESSDARLQGILPGALRPRGAALDVRG